MIIYKITNTVNGNEVDINNYNPVSTILEPEE